MKKNHSPFVEEIPRYIRGCRWLKIHWEVLTEFHEDNRTTRVDSHHWTIANPSYLLHHNFLSTLLFSGTHWERFCTNRFLVCCILCSRQNKQTNNRVSDAFLRTVFREITLCPVGIRVTEWKSCFWDFGTAFRMLKRTSKNIGWLPLLPNWKN